jgi:hypothetical protein
MGPVLRWILAQLQSKWAPRLIPGRAGCQQIVSNDSARRLAPHHRASSRILAEQG